MTETSDTPDTRDREQLLHDLFAAKAGAAIDALLEPGTPPSPADRKVVVESLATSLAAEVEKLLASADRPKVTAAAAAVTRLSAQSIAEQHLRDRAAAASAEDRAFDAYAAANFGTERTYDPDTGTRIPLVRLAR